MRGKFKHRGFKAHGIKRKSRRKRSYRAGRGGIRM